MIIHRGIDTPTVVYPHKRILICMKTWMTLTYCVALKKPDTKEYIIHDSIHMRSNDRLNQLNVMERKIVVTSGG